MVVFDAAASATYSYYQENIKPKPEAVGTTLKGETVWHCKICDYEWVERNFQMILYAQSASILRQILRK